MTKLNAIEFLNNQNIKWFPIDISEKKVPKFTGNYMPKQTDFKNITQDELKKRQDYFDRYEYIAIDTTNVPQVDIDMLDSKLYPEENMDFIKDCVSKFPYYRSLSVNKGKKQGKHLFFTTEYKFQRKRVQTKFTDIEILCGQWAWMKKSQEIIIPDNYNMEVENMATMIEVKKKKKLIIKPKKKQQHQTESDVVVSQGEEPTNKKKYSEMIELANIIDIKFLDSYDDWMRIMWCMKFISEELKETAIKISKKSSKYDEAGFNNVWDGTPDFQGITNATLYYYAKKSNVNEFKKIIRNYYLDNTDNNYAETFIKYEAENLVYKNGTVYIFIKNTWYKQDKECNQLQAIITKVLSQILKDLIKEYSDKLSNEEDDDRIEHFQNKIKAYNGMLKGIRSATGSKNICKKVIHNLSIIDYENVEFDDCPDIIPFKTQYFNLETGKFHHYKANNYILTKLTYEYETTTDEKIKFIDDLFKKIFTNVDIREDYKNILSTTLFGRPVDKFIIANGDGGNGKSVLHELLIEALEEGIFAYVAPVNVILNPIKQGNNPEVATMNNKRFIVYREPDENQLINIGTLKELTGCNTINARMNYSNETKTVLKATHILEANKKPKMKGQMDNAIYRRLIDIAFSSTFTHDEELIKENPETHFKADGYLRTTKFREEYKLPLINYLIKHIQKYHKSNELKIYDPVKVSETTQSRSKEYIANSDFVLTFVKDNITQSENPKDFVKLKDIHSRLIISEEYRNMNKDDKRKYNQKYFKESISKNGIFKKYYKPDYRYYNEEKVAKRCREVLLGFKLVVEEEDEEDF